MSNPAGRLHAILTRCRDKSLVNKPTPQAWQIILNCPNTEDLALFNKLGKVFILPEQTSLQIARFEDLDRDLFLGWRPDLTAAFKRFNFQNQFNDFASQLSDSLLINIKFCDHELEKRAPEKDVKREDLSEIITLARQLFDAVLAAKDLPPALLQYLLTQLYLIIEAIDDYDITGPGAVQRSVEATVGTIFTQNAVAVEARKTSVGAQLWDLVGKLAFILKVSKGVLELVDKVKEMLPPP